MSDTTKEVMCTRCRGSGFDGIHFEKSDMIDVLNLIKCSHNGCKNGFIEIDLTKPKDDSYNDEQNSIN